MWMYSERNWLKSMFVALWLLIIFFQKVLWHTGVFCGRVWRCLCVSSLFQTEAEYDPEHQTCRRQSENHHTVILWVHTMPSLHPVSIWPSIHHNVQWTAVVFTLWWCRLCRILWHDRPSSTGRWPPHSDRCLGTVWSHWTPPCWLRHAGLSASGYEKGQC